MSREKLREFTAGLGMPLDEFRPVVMWFWNDEIKEDEISFQLKAFKDQGINDFFIHPMYGLETDYLSDDFFSKIAFAVSEAKAMKMHYWIYDEYNWPSGTAGEKVLKECPWAKSRVLKQKTARVDAAGEWSGTVEKFVAAAARIGGETLDVTDKIRVEKDGQSEIISFKNSGAECELLITELRIQPEITSTAMWRKHATYETGYIDVFNEAAVGKFIEYTYEGYRKAVGEEFGKTVKGIFNDEPAFCNFGDTSEGTVPWSETLRDKFIKMKGYDLVPLLWRLFENTETDDEIKIKRDYREVATKAFHDAYVGQASNWCRKNGLEFTGHLLGEEFLIVHLEQFGDYLETQKLFSIPGLDSIFSWEYLDQERYNVGCSLTGSMAHFLGRDRIMCETYSGSGWDMTLAKMKRVANRLMTQGVNMVMFMGAYYSMAGLKKYLPGCYPPSHGTGNILFRSYKNLTDYIAQMSYIVSKTVKTGKTLVLFPNTTTVAMSDARYKHIWEYSLADFENKSSFRQMDATLAATVNSLINLRISFEMGFEQLFKDAAVKNGKLYYNLKNEDGSSFMTEGYEVIILPAVKYLRRKTAEKIGEFIESGGKVVLVNDVPVEEIDTFKKINYFDFPEKERFLKACGEVKERWDCPKSEIFSLSQRIKCLASNETSMKDLKGFTSMLEQIYQPFGIVENCRAEASSNIQIMQRKNESFDVYFVTNDSDKEESFKLYVSKGERSVLYDPAEGHILDVFYRSDTVTLAAYESLVVFTGGAEEIAYLEKHLPRDTGFKRGGIAFETDSFSFEACDKNMLRLEYDIYAGDPIPASGSELYTIVTGLDDSKFRKERTKYGNIGYPAVTNDFDQDTPYILKTSFEIADMPKTLELIGENIYSQKFILNGRELEKPVSRRIWDKTNIVFDITQHVHEGKNTLIITGTTPDYVMPYTAPFAVVSGNFALDESRHIIRPAEKAAEWTSAGYPYYSGLGKYTFTADLDLKDAVVEIDTEDTVALFVNGSFVNEKSWAPYRFDLSRKLKKGKNNFTIFATPTMCNLFDFSVKSGINRVRIYSVKE